MNDFKALHFEPLPKAKPAVEPGAFYFASVGLAHGHHTLMAEGLTQAGATLKWIWDEDPQKMQRFHKAYPQAKLARCEAEVLDDSQVQLISCAAIASERVDYGVRAMEAGKDFLADKAPFTSLEGLQRGRDAVARTGRKYAVYYGERCHSESAELAGQMIRQGVIGRVLQVTGMGPHRLIKDKREDWFFVKEQYGGILCDIGSHQIEQFMFFTGNEDAAVAHAQIANYENKDKPGLDDYGDAILVGENGASNYFQVHWFTPDALPAWGDNRCFITGTKGSIELRKGLDPTYHEGGSQMYVVNHDTMQHIDSRGTTGVPFFSELILDCIHRTENAMTQAHAFKAAELSILAQMQAVRLC